MDDAAIVKTLAHELAHVLMHTPDQDGQVEHRGIAEVEAESVAMMIGASFGMDTSDYSVPYVASWSTTVPDTSPVELVRATGERVRTTTLAILDQLPQPPIGDGSPPGIGRDVESSPERRGRADPASREPQQPLTASPTAPVPAEARRL